MGIEAELRGAASVKDGLAYVILLNGDAPTRVVVLTRSTSIVGRLADADVRVDDVSVSGRHAQIVSRASGFEIEDLGSTNGTFVGGKQVDRALLRSGDQVSVGNAEFMFLLERPVNATIRLNDFAKRVPVGTAPINALSVPRQNVSWLPPGTAPAPYPVAPPPARTSSDDEEGPSLAEMVQKSIAAYQFVRQRLPLILSLAAAGFVLGAFSPVVVPPKNQAVTEVKILPPMTSSSEQDRWRNFEEDPTLSFGNAIHALLDSNLIHDTLTTLDGREPNYKRIGSTMGKLKIDDLGSHVMQISYRDSPFARPTPRDFLSLHVQNYVRGEITHSLRESTAKVDFLKNQLNTVEQDLEKVGDEKAGFRQANADRLPEDEEQTHSSRFQLESRRTELAAQVRQLEEELANEQRQLSTDRPATQAKSARAEGYRQSLTEVNRKLSEAYASGLKDGHPEVQELKNERDRLQNLMKDELQSSTSPLARETDPNYQEARRRVETLQASLSAARANLADTEKSLGKVLTVVEDLPRVERHLDELNQRQDSTRSFHTELFEKLKQAEIQLNLERVSAESRYDVSPIRIEKPGRFQTLALRGGIGIFLGLLAAAISIAVMEARRLILQVAKPQVVIRSSDTHQTR